MKIKCFSNRKWNVRKIQNFTNLQPFHFNRQQHLKIAAAWENPEKIWSTFSKIQQASGYFATSYKKSASIFSNFERKIEIRASPGLLSRGWTRFFSPHGFPRFLGFDSKTVQRIVLCRSRRQLSNENFLANFGFDTAENELDLIFGFFDHPGI